MELRDYAECDCTELASLIGRGELDQSEVYTVACEAIAMAQRELNCIADGPWETPLAGERSGPLAGVPFVLKDLGSNAAGVRTRSGSRLSGDGVVSTADTFLMGKFRHAGLATAALTTTPEFGLSATTEAVLYGETRNPWDTRRSPGGSSGGTAALVAAGAVPAGHGGDSGGSLRVPASFTGLVALKPSRGRISSGPRANTSGDGLSAEFVLTRSLRDCATFLDLTAGYMPGDAFMIAPPARPWSREVGAEGARLRIAVSATSLSDIAVEPEVAEAVETVATRLESLGHHIDRASPSLDWDAFIEAMACLAAAGAYTSATALAASSGLTPSPETLEATTFDLFRRGAELRVDEVAAAGAMLNTVSRALGSFFTPWDLLLCPTSNVRPPLLGELDGNDPHLDGPGWVRRCMSLYPLTPMANVSGLPALSLPVRTSAAGLPIGIQLVAPMCDEANLFRVGGELEAAFPWASRRPPLWVGDPARARGAAAIDAPGGAAPNSKQQPKGSVI